MTGPQQEQPTPEGGGGQISDPTTTATHTSIPLASGQSNAVGQSRTQPLNVGDNTDPTGDTGGTAADETPDGPRRRIKLVLTLEPRTAAGYRVLLAVGAEGCDPVLQSSDVPDLPAALDVARVLIAEAEMRWRSHPRYPAVRPRKTAATPAAKPSRSQDSPAARQTDEQALTAPDASASTKPTAPDQLSLFG